MQEEVQGAGVKCEHTEGRQGTAASTDVVEVRSWSHDPRPCP